MTVKAVIKNDSTGEEVECMFNPKEYVFSKQNQWKAKEADKKSVSHLKFSGGEPGSLKLQLLFDTYEDHKSLQLKKSVSAGTDVREVTKGLWNMMKIDPKTKEPPHCHFKWGSLWSFEAVIESISQKFTLFSGDGTPLRAILDVSFKQITEEGVYPKQNPTSGGSPDQRIRTIHEGETLMGIAYEEYGNPAMWRLIADENGINDPLRLRPGAVLLIKPLDLF